MSEGQRGHAPDWYIDKIVADWLGVSVPDIERVPAFMYDNAILALRAENWAQREQMMRNRSR